MSDIGRELKTVVYENVQLISPYELKSLYELRIEKRVSNHTQIYFTGIVPEEEGDKYVDRALSTDTLEVRKIDNNSELVLLFKGVVTSIGIKSVRGIYYLEVEGMSFTYNLDVKLKKRSFQYKDMLYADLVKEVLAEYQGADFIDVVSKNKNIEKFIIQYEETDWQFLSRIASHFNTCLVADDISDKPKFWLGVPERATDVDLEILNYSAMKKIAVYRESNENSLNGIEEMDFTYYEVKTDKLLNIGDRVRFKGLNLVVCRSYTLVKDCLLWHQYILAPQKGLSQKLILNNKLAGVSVEGVVLDVREDNVRVHLNIDEKQIIEEAYWFPYSTFYTTEGQTGWYCMPEAGDCVKLYFPTGREEEGVIMDSVRRGINSGDKINEPDKKYFRTKYGKETMFSEKDVVISGKDNEILIKLNEDNGIEIYSEKDIKIKANNHVAMNAKKIEITAGKEIGIICKASSVKMDGDTHIKGSKVYINQKAKGPDYGDSDAEENDDIDGSGETF